MVQLVQKPGMVGGNLVPGFLQTIYRVRSESGNNCPRRGKVLSLLATLERATENIQYTYVLHFDLYHPSCQRRGCRMKELYIPTGAISIYLLISYGILILATVWPMF